MGQTLKESRWNTVQLGKASGGYNITTSAVSSTWYNQQLENSGTRLTRLKRYYDADCCSVEISRGLDILAQDISSSNADDEPIFYLEYDDDTKVKKTTIKLMNGILDVWKERTEMEEQFYIRVRNTLKYGMQVWRKQPDGSLKKLYVEKLVGYILSDHDEDEVTHYIYDPRGMRIEDTINKNFRNNQLEQKEQQPYAIPVSELVIMKLGDKPFGESVIEKVYSTWRKLAMLEDAMVIYRVVRAPERRVYYIDTGNLQGPKREAAIEKQRLRLMQKQASKQGTDITTEYDPHSTSEDIFIPTNSQGKGSRVETLPAGCLSMDTQVSLLDGRDLSIREIEKELNDGKTLWTYSVCPNTGKLAAGLITWAGVTQKSAKVMKITLDNGEEIVCTPDHKFPVQQKGFLRADEMSVGESMMPFIRDKKKLHKTAQEYERVYDISDREWKYTHRMVADSLSDIIEVNDYLYEGSDVKFNVRHHKDFNRFNNDPSNLCFMTWDGHRQLHNDNGFSIETQQKGTAAAKAWLEDIKINNPETYKAHIENISNNTKAWWESLSDVDRKEMGQKFSKGIKVYFENLSDEDRQIRAEISRENFAKGGEIFREMIKNDPDYAQAVHEKRMEYWTDENRQKHSEITTENNVKMWEDRGDELRAIHRETQTLDFSQSMIDVMIELCKGRSTHTYTVEELASDMNDCPALLNEFVEMNKNKAIPNYSVDSGFTSQVLKKLVKKYGYENYKKFRAEMHHHNHKIVAIEYLDDEIEVGTLTIDGDEKFHNYHTFALTCGIFTKNSSLGETGDLSWFHKKLAAGLKIPSSMLDVQSDEGGREQYSDMRVGQVYQVEIRYMGYVKRIQRELRPPLQEHFFEFCEDREIVIPETMKLKINAPTSFIEYKEMEVHQAKLNVFNSTLQMTAMSKKTAMQTYLMMDHEELLDNEINKLKEMGLTDEQIKNMEDNVKDNIVYGDGRLGAEFGIEASTGRF